MVRLVSGEPAASSASVRAQFEDVWGWLPAHSKYFPVSFTAFIEVPLSRLRGDALAPLCHDHARI